MKTSETEQPNINSLILLFELQPHLQTFFIFIMFISFIAPPPLLQNCFILFSFSATDITSFVTKNSENIFMLYALFCLMHGTLSIITFINFLLYTETLYLKFIADFFCFISYMIITIFFFLQNAKITNISPNYFLDQLVNNSHNIAVTALIFIGAFVPFLILTFVIASHIKSLGEKILYKFRT